MIELAVVVCAANKEDPIVEHPGQPADYVHTDGTVWTWRQRWHVTRGGRGEEDVAGPVCIRLYDLLTPGADCP